MKNKGWLSTEKIIEKNIESRASKSVPIRLDAVMAVPAFLSRDRAGYIPFSSEQ